MVEVRGDVRLVRDAQDALQLLLGGALDRLVDLLLRGRLLGCGLLGRCLLGGGGSLLGLDDLGNLLWLGGLDDTASLGLGQLDGLGLLRDSRSLYGCQ